jgi:hypothetical protein
VRTLLPLTDRSVNELAGVPAYQRISRAEVAMARPRLRTVEAAPRPVEKRSIRT